MRERTHPQLDNLIKRCQKLATALEELFYLPSSGIPSFGAASHGTLDSGRGARMPSLETGPPGSVVQVARSSSHPTTS